MAGEDVEQGSFCTSSGLLIISHLLLADGQCPQDEAALTWFCLSGEFFRFIFAREFLEWLGSYWFLGTF